MASIGSHEVWGGLKTVVHTYALGSVSGGVKQSKDFAMMRKPRKCYQIYKRNQTMKNFVGSVRKFLGCSIEGFRQQLTVLDTERNR